MSGVHVINLGTAWEPPDPAAFSAAWTRRFGAPAGIEPGDRVWLVIDAATGCEITLGGERLPPAVAGEPWRHDVTGRLGQRNVLVLVPAARGADHPAGSAVDGRQPLPLAVGRVRLEIEPAAGRA